MVEIRIYYECLEQAHDYISPMIAMVIGQKNAEVKLVKRARKASAFASGCVRAIHTLTTPDILITGIADGKEYPLVLVEFSEAVLSEDHELQRTNGAIAALLAEMFYVKVSGEKGTKKAFAGAGYNPFTTPRILSELLGYEGYIIAKWETEKDDPTRLQRHSRLPACPPDIPILHDTVQAAVVAFLEHPNGWHAKALERLRQKKSHTEFLSECNKAKGFDALLEDWAERERRNNAANRPGRTRFFVRRDEIRVTIYRFGHGMDPDRGVVTFLSFLCSPTRKVFGVYNLERQSIPQKITDAKTLRENFLAALELDKSGVPKWFREEMKAIAKKMRSLDDEFDVTAFWKANADKISRSKVLITLAFFLDGMYLNRNGAKITWNRFELLQCKRAGFIQAMKAWWGFEEVGNPMPLEEIRNVVDEDEVTYAIVHRVLQPNHFTIVSVSYPGSQGSGAVLPEASKGLAQPRLYPDVVAVPSKEAEGFDVLLEESKGMFDEAELQNALSTLIRYLDEPEAKKALGTTLIRAHVLAPNGEAKDILIGVGFGIGMQQQTVWHPARVDFIFRVVGRTRWAIGIFRQRLRALIPTIEGETRYPVCFRMTADSNQLGLF